MSNFDYGRALITCSANYPKVPKLSTVLLKDAQFAPLCVVFRRIAE